MVAYVPPRYPLVYAAGDLRLAGYLFVFQKPKYWWVNHRQTYRQELEGEYLWSPKKNQNGAKNLSYDNMIRVMPGDVVLSCADAAIRAVGVALGRTREAPKPPEFGSASEDRKSVV